MTWRVHLPQETMRALYLAVFVAAMVALRIVAFTRSTASWSPIALALLGGGFLLTSDGLLIAGPGRPWP
jgi:hypothetical protein